MKRKMVRPHRIMAYTNHMYQLIYHGTAAWIEMNMYVQGQGSEFVMRRIVRNLLVLTKMISVVAGSVCPSVLFAMHVYMPLSPEPALSTTRVPSSGM